MIDSAPVLVIALLVVTLLIIAVSAVLHARQNARDDLAKSFEPGPHILPMRPLADPKLSQAESESVQNVMAQACAEDARSDPDAPYAVLRGTFHRIQPVACLQGDHLFARGPLADLVPQEAKDAVEALQCKFAAENYTNEDELGQLVDKISPLILKHLQSDPAALRECTRLSVEQEMKMGDVQLRVRENLIWHIREMLMPKVSNKPAPAKV